VPIYLSAEVDRPRNHSIILLKSYNLGGTKEFLGAKNKFGWLPLAPYGTGPHGYGLDFGLFLLFYSKAELSQWKPRDAAINFDLQRHRRVLPAIAWLSCLVIVLCLSGPVSRMKDTKPTLTATATTKESRKGWRLVRDYLVLRENVNNKLINLAFSNRFTWRNTRSVSENEHDRLALISCVETPAYLSAVRHNMTSSSPYWSFVHTGDYSLHCCGRGLTLWISFIHASFGAYHKVWIIALSRARQTRGS